MPKGQRKRYTKEFKLSVVYAMMEETQRPKEIFEEYRVDRQTTYRWVSEYKSKGESAFDDKSVLLCGTHVKKQITSITRDGNML